MSVPNDVEWQILQTLQDISGKLDKLINLSQLGQEKELTIMKDQILGRSQIRRKIYNFCDGELTINEIAKKIGQKLPNVSTEITLLKDSGLITIKKGGKNKFPQKVI